MTQALINNLDNLNNKKEVFTQTQNKTSSKEVVGMDRTNNSFEKVIDKKINALKNKKEIHSETEMKTRKLKVETVSANENEGSVKTLQDVKTQQNKSNNNNRQC